MMSYKFTEKVVNKSPQEMWAFIELGLSNDVIIKSIKDKIPYTVNYVTKDEINFSAETRNNEESEKIGFNDFVSVIDRLKKLELFNTSSSKELFKGTKIYKKRSPFFALLLSSNVIERV
jgi:hypothetical protein